MKQIYDFERYAPPHINKKILREKAEKRRLRRYLLCLVVAAILMQIGSAMIGVQLMKTAPEMAFAWFAEGAIGGLVGVVAVVIYLYRRKEART